MGRCRRPDLCCASDGGITLTHVNLGHKRLAQVLNPLNLDFKTLILDEDQTRDVSLDPHICSPVASLRIGAVSP